jgi:hypothetical protein
MTPATYNFDVVRGSSGQVNGLTVRLKTQDADGNLINMVFDDVRLSIYDKDVKSTTKTLLLRATFENGQMQFSDEYAAEVAWVPTAEETRSLKIGAKNHYELEVRNGPEEVVYMLGVITGVGGLNDDETAS